MYAQPRLRYTAPKARIDSRIRCPKRAIRASIAMIDCFWKSQGRKRGAGPSRRQVTASRPSRQGGFRWKSRTSAPSRKTSRGIAGTTRLRPTRAPRRTRARPTTSRRIAGTTRLRLLRAPRRTRATARTSSCTASTTSPRLPRPPRTRATRATSSCTARPTRRSSPRAHEFPTSRGLPGSSPLRGVLQQGRRRGDVRGDCLRLLAEDVGDGGEEVEPRLPSLVRERLDGLCEARGGAFSLLQDGARAAAALEQMERNRRLVPEEPEELHLLEREARAPGPVEYLEDAQHALLVQERHRHQTLGHVARRLGDVARMAGVVLEIVEDERLTCHEDPARDARRGRHAHADEVLLLVAGDGREDQLVGLLVEQKDRRGLRPEDRARDLDHRAEQLRIEVVGAEDAGRDGGSEISVISVSHGRPRCPRRGRARS